MADSRQDMWAQWLLDQHFGGDPERMKKMMVFLYPIRDQVLSHIDLAEGESLLDVGCGDGLIGFGARVIFSDISQDLLDHAESLAQKMGGGARCQFLRASADELPLPISGR